VRPILVVILVALAGCSETTSPGPEAERARWVIQDDAANFAGLQVDYVTRVVEGGVLRYFALCDTCDKHGIPLDFTYKYPSDFGWNRFLYEATGDTIFYGTIVWHGRGGLEVPSKLISPYSFAKQAAAAPSPVSIEYYPICEEFIFDCRDNWERTEADSVWASARNLNIVLGLFKATLQGRVVPLSAHGRGF
jgi:hypothetical protein